jgi:hypothetical protein
MNRLGARPVPVALRSGQRIRESVQVVILVPIDGVDQNGLSFATYYTLLSPGGN